MRALEKKTNGFSLLELLVVIAIIGVISSIAYPSFKTWIKARKASAAAVKIEDLFRTINTQVQRGSYPFVQIHVEHLNDNPDKYPKGYIKITTKGMGQETLATKRSNAEDAWNTKPNERCKISDDYWDNNHINSYINEDVAVNFNLDKDAAVCFSKDGSFYSGAGEFYSATEGVEPSIDSTLYICLRNEMLKYNEMARCGIIVGGTDFEPVVKPENSEATNFYNITWSIFGNIVAEKWSAKEEKWIEQ